MSQGPPPPQPSSLDDFPWFMDAGTEPAQTCFECREKYRHGFAAGPINNLEVMLPIILTRPTQPTFYFSLKFTFPGR